MALLRVAVADHWRLDSCSSICPRARGWWKTRRHICQLQSTLGMRRTRYQAACLACVSVRRDSAMLTQRMGNQQKAAERKAKREAEGGAAPAQKKGGKKRAALVAAEVGSDNDDDNKDYDYEQEQEGEGAQTSPSPRPITTNHLCLGLFCGFLRKIPAYLTECAIRQMQWRCALKLRLKIGRTTERIVWRACYT